MKTPLSRILLKWVATILVSLLAAGLLALMVAHGFNSRPRTAALNLSRHLEHLRIGDAFDESELEVIRSYQGERVDHPRLSDGTLETIPDVCRNDAEVWYTINVNSMSPKWETKFLPLFRVGLLHRWATGSTIYVRDNKVLCVTQTISFMSDVRSDLYIVAANSDLVPSPRSGGVWHDAYKIDAGTMKARTLDVTALQSASEEQLDGLFKLNLDCITSLRPCKYPCELLPSAWQQYVKINHTARWPGPPDEDDGRCAAVAAAH